MKRKLKIENRVSGIYPAQKSSMYIIWILKGFQVRDEAKVVFQVITADNLQWLTYYSIELKSPATPHIMCFLKKCKRGKKQGRKGRQRKKYTSVHTVKLLKTKKTKRQKTIRKKSIYYHQSNNNKTWNQHFNSKGKVDEKMN